MTRQPTRARPLAATDLAGAFAAAMDGLLAAGAPWPGALAVSGGGDSLALLHLTAAWVQSRGGPAPVVLSVDHGLSPGARAVAEDVAAAAAGLGWTCEILSWSGAKPAGDLEAAARTARYRLMGEWCAAKGLAGLVLAHTLEDQAETFLLRLARGSGLDGLAAMQAMAPYPLPGFANIRLMRPLLGLPRAVLRRYLTEAGIVWHEDPMNADPRFARVRLRQAWPALEAAGLAPARIAAAAAHLGRARAALDGATEAFLAQHAEQRGQYMRIDGLALGRCSPEIGLRVLARVLMLVGGRAYRPRFCRLEALYEAIIDARLLKPRTLAGCYIAPQPGGFLVVAPESGRREVGHRDKETQGLGVINAPMAAIATKIGAAEAD